MKKIMTVCLALVMLLSMSLTAFAVDGGFLESPSLNLAPRLRSFTVDSEECEAEIIITPYSQRHTLDEESQDEIEAAYDEIKASDDLTVLNADLAALAASLGIAGTDLAVSDLFDMDYINCNHVTHRDEHGNFRITLEADTLANFVGLLHRNKGTWELVRGAVANGDTLSFSIDDFSPFAIVVDTSDVGSGDEQPGDSDAPGTGDSDAPGTGDSDAPGTGDSNAPGTGDNSKVYVWGIIAAVSALAVVICMAEAKKSTKK